MLYLLVQLDCKSLTRKRSPILLLSKTGHCYQFSVFGNWLLHGMNVVLVFGSDSPFLTKDKDKPGEMCNPN